MYERAGGKIYTEQEVLFLGFVEVCKGEASSEHEEVLWGKSEENSMKGVTF